MAAIVPGEKLPGKQHPRTRWGLLADEVRRLDAQLTESDLSIQRALCRFDLNHSSMSDDVLSLQGALKSIDRIDGLVELSGDDEEMAFAAAETLVAAHRAGMRVYFGPFIDFDRTMDVQNGLLDTLCNPRPAFHVLRNLNTILCSGEVELLTPGEPAEGRVCELVSGLVSDGQRGGVVQPSVLFEQAKQ